MFTSYKRILNYSITKAQTSRGNKKRTLNKQTCSSSGVFIFLLERETRELIKCIQSIIQGITSNGFTQLSIFKFIFQGYFFESKRRWRFEGGGEGLELHTSIPRPSVLHPHCLHISPTVCTSGANLTFEIFTLDSVTVGHGGDNFVKSLHFCHAIHVTVSQQCTLCSLRKNALAVTVNLSLYEGAICRSNIIE